ncbi:MAG: type VI secretion protein IcmF/TssM N-terminal domain-containing protein [Syntrophobacteraceae bacterium]
MKDKLVKFFKWFFIVTAGILVVLLVFGGVLLLDWPWWVGIFILLGIIGLGIAMLFVKKIWARRREQKFVHQIIEQDEAQLSRMAEKDRSEARELQDRWKEAIEALRRSHLRKKGNPLYVLPWYLVIGESASGKTTAIQSARLSSPFFEVNQVSGLSGTRNCDWWFFEQAVVIDTAGRYTIRIDEQRDKEEWQKFLALLTKYRQREPLNGLIVSVAADKILGSDPEALMQDGANVRRRIDELMRVLGVKFPVYVLVTKCDLIQGMTQFCAQLPEPTLDQAMGRINADLSTKVTNFLGEVFDRIGERLRDLRLLIFQKTDAKKIDPAFLLFPEEFEKLKNGLEPFMKGAFQENPYQETPILRGLFFSSGRQEGSPYSHFLQALGLIEEREVLPGTNKGLFLHDVFAKILPKDRSLFAPTRRSVEWNRITRNLGLTSWIALGLAICGLLSFAFVKNLRVLRVVTHEFSEKAEFHGEILTDMTTLDRFRQVILKVEDENRHWLIPRFSLNQSRDVEIGLKDYYCKQFQKSFLVSFDDQMAGRMTRFTPAVPDEMLGQHVSHLVRRINLIKGRLEGLDLGALQIKPQPAYDPTLSPAPAVMGTPGKDLFGQLYLYYLIWRFEPAELNVELGTLQKWLEHLLALKPDLHWLVGWADGQPTLTPVAIEDFWRGSLPMKTEIKVAPAYTHKGKGEIDAFVMEIEAAVKTPQMLAVAKTDFTAWYPQQYLQSWNNFLTLFPRGVERLKGRDEWQQTAAKMAGDDGPYWAVLDRAASELDVMAFGKDLPPWVKLILQVRIIKARIAAEAAAQNKGLLSKATDSGKKLVGDIEKMLSKVPGLSLDAQAKAAPAYGEFQKNLDNVAPVSASRKLAFEMTAQVYGEDEVTGQSTFYSATKAEKAFKNTLTSGSADEEPFWTLVDGPLAFLWTYMRYETGCYLQRQWEEEVLSETQGVADGQIVQQRILGENGFAWKFVKGTVGPFLSRSPQKGGYYAKDHHGETIDFENAFFTCLNKGISVAATSAAAAAGGGGSAPAARSNFSVTLQALPTDANPDAKVKPSATHLELRCGPMGQKLDNYNYPSSATFNWSPETCSDVFFSIEVGDVVLNWIYDGDMGFPRFLRDLRGGDRTFSLNDRTLNARRSDLERLGIKYITVRYRMSGHGPVIALLTPKPQAPLVQIPNRIARCWDQ